MHDIMNILYLRSMEPEYVRICRERPLQHTQTQQSSAPATPEPIYVLPVVQHEVQVDVATTHLSQTRTLRLSGLTFYGFWAMLSLLIM